MMLPGIQNMKPSVVSPVSGFMSNKRPGTSLQEMIRFAID
jgi:hypothetical protein